MVISNTRKDKISSIRTNLKIQINEFRDLLGRLEKVVADEIGGRLNPSQLEEVSEVLFMGIVYPGQKMLEALDSIYTELGELEGQPGFMGVREGNEPLEWSDWWGGLPPDYRTDLVHRVEDYLVERYAGGTGKHWDDLNPDMRDAIILYLQKFPEGWDNPYKKTKSQLRTYAAIDKDELNLVTVEAEDKEKAMIKIARWMDRAGMGEKYQKWIQAGRQIVETEYSGGDSMNEEYLDLMLVAKEYCGKPSKIYSTTDHEINVMYDTAVPEGDRICIIDIEKKYQDPEHEGDTFVFIERKDGTWGVARKHLRQKHGASEGKSRYRIKSAGDSTNPDDVNRLVEYLSAREIKHHRQKDSILASVDNSDDFSRVVTHAAEYTPNFLVAFTSDNRMITDMVEAREHSDELGAVVDIIILPPDLPSTGKESSAGGSTTKEGDVDYERNIKKAIEPGAKKVDWERNIESAMQPESEVSVPDSRTRRKRGACKECRSRPTRHGDMFCMTCAKKLKVCALCGKPYKDGRRRQPYCEICRIISEEGALYVRDTKGEQLQTHMVSFPDLTKCNHCNWKVQNLYSLSPDNIRAEGLCGDCFAEMLAVEGYVIVPPASDGYGEAAIKEGLEIVTPQRAREIIKQAKERIRTGVAIGPWSDQIRHIITEDERRYVNKEWDKMPSHYSFVDALNEIGIKS